MYVLFYFIIHYVSHFKLFCLTIINVLLKVFKKYFKISFNSLSVKFYSKAILVLTIFIYIHVLYMYTNYSLCNCREGQIKGWINYKEYTRMAYPKLWLNGLYAELLCSRLKMKKMCWCVYGSSLNFTSNTGPRWMKR